MFVDRSFHISEKAAIVFFSFSFEHFHHVVIGKCLKIKPEFASHVRMKYRRRQIRLQHFCHLVRIFQKVPIISERRFIPIKRLQGVHKKLFGITEHQIITDDAEGSSSLTDLRTRPKYGDFLTAILSSFISPLDSCFNLFFPELDSLFGRTPVPYGTKFAFGIHLA